MSFLPNNNTAFKRRLIKEDPVEEEEEDDCLFENQESENLSEIQVQAKQTSDFMHDANVEHLKFQPASVIAPPKEASKKAPESSGSASGFTLTNPLSNLPEFGLVLKAMSLKVRPSTAAAYRKSSKEWQTQIALRNDENEKSELTLLEIAENAPSNKNSNLIKKYKHDPVYDQVQTNAERSARCVIRGSDKSGELIRMLKTIWVFNSETGLREVFSISSHHMLIRDQYLDRHDATTVPRSKNTIVDSHQQCLSTMPLQCNFFFRQ
ncbi:hypothetical protein G6F42_013233 [Rhizopus arrhizus]|nr:hypothetical protein G6F42_013233 [Rhizopus arrhizus]